ncbi:MAG: DNA recombination/repair protein RecA, partial [Acetobacteraceae bacterium]|nr:DNA recombination/repair protein RecA [Acetobacteraceae bacterium]
QGRENAKQFMRDNPDMAASVEQRVRAQAGIVANSMLAAGGESEEDERAAAE